MPCYTVAMVQLAVGRDLDANLQKCVAALDTAAGQGARLVVFPEFSHCLPGFPSAADAYPWATTEDGTFLTALRNRARRHGIWVAVNSFEKGEPPAMGGPRIWSTSWLIAATGAVVLRYRKQLLFGPENHWLTPGNLGFPVAETPLGRVGFYTCMDGLIPESSRCLAVSGAQVLINCLNSAGPDEPDIHIPVRAAENGTWVLAANKVGPIPGGTLARSFIGGSEIIAPNGEVLARAGEGEEIIYGEVNLERAVPCPWLNADPLAGRRPETYGLLADPAALAGCRNRWASTPAMPVRAAAVSPPQPGVAAAAQLVSGAAAAGARLAVLPALWQFEPGAAAADLAAAAAASREGWSALAGLATHLDLWIAADGIAPAVPGGAAAGAFAHELRLLGPAGTAARYAVVHPDAAAGSVRPGSSYAVATTPFGLVGLMGPGEDLYPEVARTLGLMGADLIVQAAAWRDVRELELLLVERAAENHVHVLAAGRADAAAGIRAAAIPVVAFPTTPHWRVRWPELRTAAPGESLLLQEFDLAISRDKTSAPGTDLFDGRHPASYSCLVR